ncbi:MAG: hypothetical protein E6L02_03785 [Thaumarchaeota archaeon]|nr:MAG: hypothetical protein E6L02_03785 [Nitrososphaerota archaeon]
MKIGIKLIPAFILILLVPLTSYEQQTGTLEIDLKSVSGEMTDYHGMTLKIYQDNQKIPFKIIDSLTSNPYKVSLPIGYQYKVEVYASSMYANLGYVDLQDSNEKLDLIIPNPGSILFTAVYNDGLTPITNATVVVKSSNGTYEYWTPSTTNEDGKTIRFWLQPTISNDDYYIANISIGKNLSYNYYPINILQGASNNIKIVTPWPSVAPPLVATVYKSSLQKVSKSDGNLVLQLYDNNDNKISESKVDVRGKAYFSNLKVGSYILRAIDLNGGNNRVWGVTNIILDGKQTSVQIFKNQTNNKILNTTQTVLYSNEGSVNSDPITISQNVQTVISHDLLIDIKAWNDNSSTISNSKLLSDVGIKANHIPSWITNNAKWVMDGKITEIDFVNAIMYLHTSGIIK